METHYRMIAPSFFHLPQQVLFGYLPREWGGKGEGAPTAGEAVKETKPKQDR